MTSIKKVSFLTVTLSICSLLLQAPPQGGEARSPKGMESPGDRVARIRKEALDATRGGFRKVQSFFESDEQKMKRVSDELKKIQDQENEAILKRATDRERVSDRDAHYRKKIELDRDSELEQLKEQFRKQTEDFESYEKMKRSLAAVVGRENIDPTEHRNNTKDKAPLKRLTHDVERLTLMDEMPKASSLAPQDVLAAKDHASPKDTALMVHRPSVAETLRSMDFKEMLKRQAAAGRDRHGRFSHDEGK